MKWLIVLAVFVMIGLGDFLPDQPDCTWVPVPTGFVGHDSADVDEIISAKVWEFKIAAVVAKIDLLTQMLEVPAGVGFSAPVDSAIITCGYQDRLGQGRFHPALDFGCPVGEGIRAITQAVVTRIGHDNISGRFVYLAFHDMKGRQYELFYAHLSDVLVDVGQVVKAGYIIALSGQTGRVTGPHLHLEMHRVERGDCGEFYPLGYVNPTRYFAENGAKKFTSRFCCGEAEILASLK